MCLLPALPLHSLRVRFCFVHFVGVARLHLARAQKRTGEGRRRRTLSVERALPSKPLSVGRRSREKHVIIFAGLRACGVQITQHAMRGRLPLPLLPISPIAVPLVLNLRYLFLPFFYFRHLYFLISVWILLPLFLGGVGRTVKVSQFCQR